MRADQGKGCSGNCCRGMYVFVCVSRSWCKMYFSKISWDKSEEQAGRTCPARDQDLSWSLSDEDNVTLEEQTDKWNKAESPERDLHMMGHVRAWGKEKKSPCRKYIYKTHIQKKKKKSPSNRLKGLKCQKQTLKLLVEKNTWISFRP